MKRDSIKKDVDLIFKIKDGQKPRVCQWRVNDEDVKPDKITDHSKYSKNTFKLQFTKNEFGGRNECIVSTAKCPIVSTAIEIYVESGKHTCFMHVFYMEFK